MALLSTPDRSTRVTPAVPAAAARDLVLVVRADAFGGAERHTVDLVNHLTSAGWRLTLVMSGQDLVARGIRAAGDTLEIVRTELPVCELSRADVRAWREVFQG